MYVKPGDFLYAKACKRSCQWQVLCIPKYAIKAAGGRFYVLPKYVREAVTDLNVVETTYI